MSRGQFPLLAILIAVQSAACFKIVSVVEPYLGEPSSSEDSDKELDDEDLPVYRDLPPVMKATKDLPEALEATRNLKFVRPPFTGNEFTAEFRKAADEYRATVIGVAPPPGNLQFRKSGSFPNKPIKAHEAATAKPKSQTVQAENTSSPGIVQDSTKKKSNDSHDNLREDNVGITAQENSKMSANEKTPMDDAETKKSDNSYVDLGEEGNGTQVEEDYITSDIDEDEVMKLAVEEDDPTAVTISDTESPPLPPETGVQVAVNVEAPYTHVQVKRGSNNGHSRYGADVGVHVEAPFTNVKVKKLADIPADSLPDPNGGGSGGSYPDMGVRVEAPFVRVKVDGPAYHSVPGSVDVDTRPSKRRHRDDHPRRSGRPLNLDINIPGIFNLKLLKDETGRGRLGIGVLPVFSSLVNPHKASDPYPGPPPPSY